MTILDPLTALEREQLRYIVERVPEWPEGAKRLWSHSTGTVKTFCGAVLFENVVTAPLWPTYSPDFTRAQYDAMKAEMVAEAVKCCGNPSQCWEPCGDLGNSEEHAKVSDIDLPPMTPKTCTIDYRAHCEALAEALDDLISDAERQMRSPSHHPPFSLSKAQAALTRWKEDSK